MRRRDLLRVAGAGVAALAAPRIGRAERADKLVFVPTSDLAVLDPAIADFKASARQFLQNASAVVINQPERRSIRWDKSVLEQVMRKPIFRVRPPHYLTADLVEFVRKKLQKMDQRA